MSLPRHAKLNRVMLKKVSFIKNIRYARNIFYLFKKRCFSVVKIEDIRL